MSVPAVFLPQQTRRFFAFGLLSRFMGLLIVLQVGIDERQISEALLVALVVVLVD